MNAKEYKAADPRGFERAYMKWCECIDFDSEWLIEQAIEEWQGIELWVNVKDVHWSGFWSQGDGLGFKGGWDMARAMEVLGYHETHNVLYLDAKMQGTRMEIKTSARRSYYILGVDAPEYPGISAPHGVYADMDADDWEEMCVAQSDEVWAELETAATTYLRNLADTLYNELESQYEYEMSEEAYIEYCDANEVTFEIEEEVV